MTIDRKNCVKSIVDWNHKKSWANYKAVCKYRKCETKWIAEGELNYYLGV